MGRDRTRVGGSTDVLSSGARGKQRGFSPAAAVRPLDRTRVMWTVNRGECPSTPLSPYQTVVEEIAPIHMFNSTDMTCRQIKMGMVAYLGGDHHIFNRRDKTDTTWRTWVVFRPSMWVPGIVNILYQSQISHQT